MLKAELVRWQKEADTQHSSSPLTDDVLRTTLLREKENVKFILNNESFELDEEVVSSSTSHAINPRERGLESTLIMDYSLMHNNSRLESPMGALTLGVPSSTAVHLSLHSSSIARRSATLSSRGVPDTPPVATADRPIRSYHRRGKKRPDKLSLPA